MQIKSVKFNKTYKDFNNISNVRPLYSNHNGYSRLGSNNKESNIKNPFMSISAALLMAAAIFTTSPAKSFATYTEEQTALIHIATMEKENNINAIIDMLNKPIGRKNPLYTTYYINKQFAKLKKNDAYKAAENVLIRLIENKTTNIEKIKQLDANLQPEAKNKLKYYTPSYEVFNAINTRLGRNIEINL